MNGNQVSGVIDLSEPVTLHVLPVLPGSILEHHERVFSDSRLLRKRWILYKRSQDIILGTILLVSLCLIILGIGVWIKVDSAGPVLFSQPRRGRNNVHFRCFKFRTMFHSCADLHAQQQSIRIDSRVTRAGNTLRRLSMDELPQLLNVMQGHMSLIGPRPHAIGTNINGELLTDLRADYLLRYQVKPGITGWAQVNGSRGILDSKEKLDKRLHYDFQYITNWSPLLDARILYRTIFCIFDHHAF